MAQRIVNDLSLYPMNLRYPTSSESYTHHVVQWYVKPKSLVKPSLITRHTNRSKDSGSPQAPEV